MQKPHASRLSKQPGKERSRRAVRLDSWVDQQRKQLRRLPNALTDPIPDRETKLAQRNKIKATIAARIEDAKTAGKGELAASLAESDGRTSSLSNRTTMKRTTAILRVRPLRCVTSRTVSPPKGGRSPTCTPKDDSYDLYAERGSEQRCVEAKGLAGNASSAGVRLTGGELAKASQLGDEYWLYVVENCFDGEGRLYAAWQNPAETFRDSFTDVPIVRLRGSELKAALGQQGEAA